MNLPEGYLFELFKDLLRKQVSPLDDLTLLAVLAPTVQGRLRFSAEDSFIPVAEAGEYSLQEVIESRNDLFDDLVHAFLRKSAVSGVQPKCLADLKDKVTLTTGEYMVKSFGPQFPNLCENEFFCLTAARCAGLDISPFYLSHNRKLLVMELFTGLKSGDKQVGFEEVGTLMGRTRDDKYSGSYEQVAETVRTFSSPEYRAHSLYQLYLNIVLSYILRNGDAHLKNFGLIYYSGGSDSRVSPAYDLVTTQCYLPRDTPALMLRGRKAWWGKKTIVEFGVQRCGLSPQQSALAYASCETAVRETALLVERYIQDEPGFREIGVRMLQAWNEGLLGEG
jgi:serine/threonine-protein kinase HipA